jgi:hypothetical protein
MRGPLMLSSLFKIKMEVQFQRIQNGRWEIYKQNYATQQDANADANFLSTNGYWFDSAGAFHSAGSVFATKTMTTTTPLT